MKTEYSEIIGGFQLRMVEHPVVGTAHLEAKVHQTEDEYAAILVESDCDDGGYVIVEHEASMMLERVFVYMSAFDEPLTLTPRMIQPHPNDPTGEALIKCGTEDELERELENVRDAIKLLGIYEGFLMDAKAGKI